MPLVSPTELVSCYLSTLTLTFDFYSCFPPNNHLFTCYATPSSFICPSSLTWWSFPLVQTHCPMPSCFYCPSTKSRGSRLRGVLFVIGSYDLHGPPWHRVNYSLRGNYTSVPRESPRQPDGRKKWVYYHGGARWWISCSLVECRYKPGEATQGDLHS